MRNFLLPAALILLLTLPSYASKDDIPEVKFQRIFLTDTSEAEDYIEPENITLKGYAQYIEDTEAIYLTDDNNQFVLNLKVPQKITTPVLTNLNENILPFTLIHVGYGDEKKEARTQYESSRVTIIK